MLTITEAAKLLGTTRQRVWQLIKEGFIEAEMLGSSNYVIKESAIENLKQLRLDSARPLNAVTTCKKHGPLTAENAYKRFDGTFRCRSCAKAIDKARRDKKKRVR